MLDIVFRNIYKKQFFINNRLVPYSVRAAAIDVSLEFLLTLKSVQYLAPLDLSQTRFFNFVTDFLIFTIMYIFRKDGLELGPLNTKAEHDGAWRSIANMYLTTNIITMTWTSGYLTKQYMRRFRVQYRLLSYSYYRDFSGLRSGNRYGCLVY